MRETETIRTEIFKVQEKFRKGVQEYQAVFEGG